VSRPAGSVSDVRRHRADRTPSDHG
jgi:hypothetical protein